ncbi:MAG TPA: hypothetical protein VIJ28_24130 [Chloroflexota bacterium]|jgi:hypothetical protein
MARFVKMPKPQGDSTTFDHYVNWDRLREFRIGVDPSSGRSHQIELVVEGFPEPVQLVDDEADELYQRLKEFLI